jgi:FkbM family methyltransferase
MQHAAVFSRFSQVKSRCDGESVYDFLGVATEARFKNGWSAHVPKPGREFTPAYPALNEHYFDWILTLESVARAKGAYRMAEFGAGWGTWAVRAAAAAAQRSEIARISLLAVEADRTHFDWMRSHFTKNGLNPNGHHLLHGAVAARRGDIRFPVVVEPDRDYGASIINVSEVAPFVLVAGYTIKDLLDRFDGPVDFVHSDMQGAEYETIPPAMGILGEKVKSIMIGTHVSPKHHAELAELFREAGWRERMNYMHGSKSETEFGTVQFGDGLIAFTNPKFVADGGAP